MPTDHADARGPKSAPRYHIRRGTVADTEVIAQYNLAMALETEDKHLEPAVIRAGVRRALEDPTRGLYYVAEVANSAHPLVVCQTMITPEWTDWYNGWNWWIQSVYVHPDHRRHGVFSLVYEQIRAAARRDPNVHGLRLYVDRDNHPALRCYQKVGMTESRYLIYEEETDA